jgi:hypothetical protein
MVDLLEPGDQVEAEQARDTEPGERGAAGVH